jgi:hypothetical protein
MGSKSIIVIHWWGNPADKPSLMGTVNWLCNPAAKVSAHYVVSGRTVYQLVAENNVAWHAISANPFSIGIEVDPNTPPGTYETVSQLCKEIATRHLMALPSAIRAHRDYVNTQCPGTLDLERIRRGAVQGDTEMNIIVRPIGKLQVTLAKGIQMYDFEHNKALWNSGTYMELTQKTNIINGSTYYVPEDRADKGELFGFKEEDVYAKGNVVKQAPDSTPAIDPAIIDKAKKYDQIKSITG